MQLRIARLCHDCEEVHAAQQCPVCASETFTFLTRWVPAPERRATPRPPNALAGEEYLRINTPEPPASGTKKLLKGTALGLTVLGLVSWVWRRTHQDGAPVRAGDVAAGDVAAGDVAAGDVAAGDVARPLQRSR